MEKTENNKGIPGEGPDQGTAVVLFFGGVTPLSVFSLFYLFFYAFNLNAIFFKYVGQFSPKPLNRTVGLKLIGD